MVLSQILIFLVVLFVVKEFFLDPFKKLQSAKAQLTTDLLSEVEKLEKQTQENIVEIEDRVGGCTQKAKAHAQQRRGKAQKQSEHMLAEQRAKSEQTIKEFKDELAKLKVVQIKAIDKYPQLIAQDVLINFSKK
jgi:F0F1-type ATP synthase membrane subunit b/b'